MHPDAPKLGACRGVVGGWIARIANNIDLKKAASMKKTGIIAIELGESRLDGELLLVKDGRPTEAGAATDLLSARNIHDGQRAMVSGTEGSSGSETVIFVEDAEPALAGAAFAQIKMGAAGHRVAKKGARKSKARAKQPKKKTAARGSKKPSRRVAKKAPSRPRRKK
jgi:hypothetical protein